MTAFINSAPFGSPSLSGRRTMRLKKSSLSNGRQIWRNVRMEPRSYKESDHAPDTQMIEITLGEFIYGTVSLAEKHTTQTKLTIGVPLSTHLRCASSAHTDLAIFVFGFRILCPSSKMTRFHLTSNMPFSVFRFFCVGSSPARVVRESSCSLTTVWYVVITTSYFLSCSGVIFRPVP